jgi:FlaA1/EpsC-like NDP-sugar epimerase
MNGKTVLITGGTGSLGHRLVERIFRDFTPKKLIVFSRDEYKQSLMQRDCHPDLRFFLGDVRDKERLCQALVGVDVVIHAAALKQIPALEYNPTEAVKTNVDGTQNVIEACIECGVEKAILTSTDKAVNPINLYGATKLVAEKLFIAANTYNSTKFSCVRYGNVIGSRGSVIPLFEKLIAQGEAEIPITDIGMTRFWITLDEAVDLVFVAYQAEELGIFIPQAKSMKIVDIAHALDPDCYFREIGIRPGEKLHEALVSEDNEGVWCDGKPAEKNICSSSTLFLTNDEFLYKMHGPYKEMKNA